MASVKFLEEALSTDVDESAVNAIVGTLENQLGNSSSSNVNTQQNTGLQQNHVNNNNNGAISNGGTTTTTTTAAVVVATAPQKHGAIANGDTTSISANIDKPVMNNNAFINAVASSSSAAITSAYNLQDQKPPESVKIVYSQGGQQQVIAGGQGTIVQGRTTTVQQQIPNGAIGMAPQTVLGTAPSTVHHQVQVQQQKAPTIVLKAAATPSGTPSLVTLPVNAVAQSNNATQNIQTTLGMPTQPIISNLQVLNVRPQVGQAKGQQRVLLSAAAPGLVGARPGTPQLTLQSFHGLQPGQQGALLLKTENGQYQLLRVGPAPQTANLSSQPGGGQPVTFRMQTVPAQATVNTSNPPQSNANTTSANTTQPAQQNQPKPGTDNTKEKCRKFLANLLELSNREPKSVERNVRTLIQELIDSKVEPEDFCDKLERLLNASPQPCLIGFLKKSLPLLRHSLATNEMTIDGIKPPQLTTTCPMNVVFSVAGAAPTVQTVRPVTQVVTPGQVRIVAPAGTAVVRPAATVRQQRLVTPIRGPTIQQQTRMITTIRQPNAQTISSSQPPALHPVYPTVTLQHHHHHQQQLQSIQSQSASSSSNNHQQQQQQPTRTAAISRPVQLKSTGQSRSIPQRSQGGAGAGGGGGGSSGGIGSGSKGGGAGAGKGGSGQGSSRPTAKEKEKKGFSSAYTGDDDINDVAAMGGVNLAEETQKILGPTEHVGTQIRSCKEDIMCSTAPLQYKIRQILLRHGLEEPTTGDVAACISHAAQERLRDLIEKAAVITGHRLEMVKSDPRYEVTNDKKGQLKFLEDLDKTERKKYEEIEREMLLRAAKSRSKTEDPEQAKLKAKAKEMQRVEMEELRQREANATALQAIGPRKKPRLDLDSTSNSVQNSTTGPNNTLSRGQMPLRQRIKKVTMRDLQFLFESEKDLCKSKLLYKSYLK